MKTRSPAPAAASPKASPLAAGVSLHTPGKLHIYTARTVLHLKSEAGANVTEISISANHVPLAERAAFVARQKANAEHIVRTWNSHEELLDQAKVLERVLIYQMKVHEGEGDDEGVSLNGISLGLLRDVISRAEGR